MLSNSWLCRELSSCGKQHLLKETGSHERTILGSAWERCYWQVINEKREKTEWPRAFTDVLIQQTGQNPQNDMVRPKQGLFCLVNGGGGKEMKHKSACQIFADETLLTIKQPRGSFMSKRIQYLYVKELCSHGQTALLSHLHLKSAFKQNLGLL